MKDIGVLSPNELRVELGFDEKPEKEANSIFLPQNLAPITDDEEMPEQTEAKPDEMTEIDEGIEEKPEELEEKSYIKQS